MSSNSINWPVLCLCFLTTLACQSQAQVVGLGNGRDLLLRTAIDTGSLSSAAKLLGPSSLLSVNLSSPLGGLNGLPAIVAVDLRHRSDTSVLQLPGELNAMGIGPNFFFLLEGSGLSPAIIPGVWTLTPGGTNVSLPLPDLSTLGPIAVFLQGATYDLGAVNGVALTRAVRHDAQILATTSTLDATEYANGTQFGYGLTLADVNADGNDDVLSGMISADPTGVLNCGEVRIYLSPSHTSTQAILPPSPQANAGFGNIIRVADVTGDSVVDLIVGARFEDVPGLQDAGAVYVFAGPSFASSTRLQAPAPEFQGRFGLGLTTADWDQDGVHDVCVGSPRATSTGGVAQAGKVFIFRGGPLTLLAALDNPTPTFGDKFGDALLGADFTGDGREDLFVGAPGRDTPPATDCGGAFLFPGGSLVASVTLSQPADTDAELGNGFAAADMDGDGALDVICGTEFANGPFVDSGQVMIAYGPTFSLRTTINSPIASTFAAFGSAASVGDLNFDGFPDILVGEMYATVGGQSQAGQAWALFGPTFEQSRQLQPADPVAVGNFGRRVAIGDMDGDGFQDAAVSAPLADPFGPSNNQEGRIYLFR